MGDALAMTVELPPPPWPPPLNGEDPGGEAKESTYAQMMRWLAEKEGSSMDWSCPRDRHKIFDVNSDDPDYLQVFPAEAKTTFKPAPDAPIMYFGPPSTQDTKLHAATPAGADCISKKPAGLEAVDRPMSPLVP